MSCKGNPRIITAHAPIEAVESQQRVHNFISAGLYTV